MAEYGGTWWVSAVIYQVVRAITPHKNEIWPWWGLVWKIKTKMDVYWQAFIAAAEGHNSPYTYILPFRAMRPLLFISVLISPRTLIRTVIHHETCRQYLTQIPLSFHIGHGKNLRVLLSTSNKRLKLILVSCAYFIGIKGSYL